MRLQLSLATKRLIGCAVLAKLLLFGCVGVGAAQEPAATLFDVARQTAQKQQLNKSALLGFGIMKNAFSDIPAQGGILIGFDIQLSKFFDHETVHAIKPIYATQAGEITTTEFGDFGTKPGKKKNPDLTRMRHGSILGNKQPCWTAEIGLS